MSVHIDISPDLEKTFASLIRDRSFLSKEPQKKAELHAKLTQYFEDFLEEQRKLQGKLTEDHYFELQRRLLKQLQSVQASNKDEQIKQLTNKEKSQLKNIINNVLYNSALKNGILKSLKQRVLFRAKMIKRLRAYYRYRRRRKIRLVEKERLEAQRELDEIQEKEDALLKSQMKQWEKDLEKENKFFEENIMPYRILTEKELQVNVNNTSDNIVNVIALMHSILKLDKKIPKAEMAKLKKEMVELKQILLKLDKSSSPEAFSKGLNKDVLDRLDRWHTVSKKHLDLKDTAAHKILDDSFREIEQDILSWIKKEKVKPRFKEIKQKKILQWKKLMTEGPKIKSTGEDVDAANPQVIPLQQPKPEPKPETGNFPELQPSLRHPAQAANLSREPDAPSVESDHMRQGREAAVALKNSTGTNPELSQFKRLRQSSHHYRTVKTTPVQNQSQHPPKVK